jgi:hypothetical protein
MRITEYQIRTTAGDILRGYPSDLSRLSQLLVEEGRSVIAKISFYFRDPTEPEAFLNLILRNQQDMFVPEYCTDDVELQQLHMSLVLKALDFRNLDDQFVRYIIR